jgi:hypothetical protein
MFKFKVKYTDDKGNPVEIEIKFNLPSLPKFDAASKLGISPSNIISIRKM